MKSKGQMQVIFGIVVILVIVGAILGFKFLGGDSEEKPPSEEELARAQEGAPLRTNLLPSGILPSGTKETKISVTTNEPSYCRYSTKSDQTYDDMSSRFSYDKSKTLHSATVKNLKNGQTYTYYVRCRDLAGNKNEDNATIQFSIAGSAAYSPEVSSGKDETPPQRTNLLPNGGLPAGTTETQISVSTNEPGYCRYSTEPGQTYDKMSSRFSYDKNKMLHTAKVRGLADNRIYEYYVRCRDIAGNKNAEDAVIRFGVGGVSLPSVPVLPGQDVIAPYCFDGFPDDDLPGGTYRTTLSFKTDEKAFCRYSTVAGLSYDAMNQYLAGNGSTFHSVEITGLEGDKEYKYYIKCADEMGNKNNNDFIIAFHVEKAEDFTPPERLNPYPTGDIFPASTTQTMISISTNEPATCRYSSTQGTAYSSMKGSFSADTTKKYHTATIKKLEPGKSYEYFVRCKDLEGNVNTGDVMIYFSTSP
jgi:hypothetical protein